MKITEKTLKSLLERASTLGIPSVITVPVVKLFVKQVNDSGLEWTVTRFKSLKVDFIRHQAGLPIITPWVAKKDNYFRGPIGGLQRWAARSERNFKLAIQLLQVYSYFISPEVTDNQSSKFVNAVQSDELHHNLDAIVVDMLQGVKAVFPDPGWYPDPECLALRPTSLSRNEPHASGKSYPEGEVTFRCAKSFLDQTRLGRDLMVKYPVLFSSVLSGVACSVSNEHIEYGSFNDIVGKIGLIQEPGYKLRAVANPARVYQQALKPLGDDLYRRLRQLPWDCTHDQSLPFSTIQKHLSLGKTAHAVDLSNATDTFPFRLQYEMLKQMYSRHDAIELFYDLSRAPWQCDLTPEKTISWTKGQPLGLYPSFAAFAMCHGFVLYSLNGMVHNGDFFVLGDDVVILNDGLHDRYMSFLETSGIQFSESKTVTSSILTEFGGKIITKSNVIPQIKWRRISDDSFLDIAKLIGIKSKHLLLPRQKVVFDAVKDIPDFLGGCGFNSAGLPLSTRVEKYLTLFGDDTLMSYLLSYNRLVQKLNYEPVSFLKKQGSVRRVANDRLTLLPRDWYISTPLVETLDQRVMDLLNAIPLPRARTGNPVFQRLVQTVDKDFPWCALGTFVYNAFPRERYLLIEGTERRKTTLEVMESKL